MRIISVNGRRWSPDVLRNALSATKTAKDGITLQVDNNDVVSNLLDQILSLRIAASFVGSVTWHREFVVKDCDGRLLAFGAEQE
jgi:hypothetical protein